MRIKRLIFLKHVHNLRTLGGLKTIDGRRIREGILLRSAELSKVKEREMRILKERYGLKTVIDLRTLGEVEKHPDVTLEGIQYLYLPVCREQIPGVSREAEPGSKSTTADMLPDLRDTYRLLITDPETMGNFKPILETILRNRDGAILWHCTAGKDRCGMVAVMLESLLGADAETIRRDYLLTNLDSGFDACKYAFLIRVFKRDKAFARKVFLAYAAKTAYLNAALDRIREEYGRIEDYLVKGVGIDPEDIRAFREYALTKM